MIDAVVCTAPCPTHRHGDCQWCGGPGMLHMALATDMVPLDGGPHDLWVCGDCYEHDADLHEFRAVWRPPNLPWRMRPVQGDTSAWIKSLREVPGIMFDDGAAAAAASRYEPTPRAPTLGQPRRERRDSQVPAVSRPLCPIMSAQPCRIDWTTERCTNCGADAGNYYRRIRRAQMESAP